MKRNKLKSLFLSGILAVSFLLSGCSSASPEKVLAKADEAFENGKYTLALRKYSVVMESLKPEQEMNIGWMYYTGNGASRNLKKALEWYDKAAASGSPEAMYTLGEIYETGPKAIADENKAAVFYYKAADAGSVEAMFSLGRCYENGTGVEGNFKEAVTWYEKAAETGSKDAMLSLVRIYESGVLGDQEANVEKWRALAEEQPK